MKAGLYKMKKPSPMKFEPMTTMALIGGAASILGGLSASRAAKAQQGRARRELKEAKARWMSLDFSNPYDNLENPYEDLTVNQKQAQFMAQQGQQQRVDIMQASRGAAGASGVAGLAQAMANQGQIQAQRISALIGKQEAVNQKLRAKGAAAIQSMERQGEVMSRGWKANRAETLYGMGMQQMTAANQARAAAKAQIWGGVGQLAGGLVAGGAFKEGAWTKGHENYMWQ